MRTQVAMLRIITLLLLPILTISSDAIGQKKKQKKSIPVDQSLVLAEGQLSRYRIVLPASPTQYESRAAEVLQSHLLEISGAALPIVSVNETRSRYEIVLGQNERLDELNLNINLNALKEDGFIIRTDSSRLLITGGNEKGTLYGVYTFLEDYLNCRMYTPTVKVIPKVDRIALNKINDTQVPVIGFRDTHYRVTWNDEYTEWHKLDHDANGARTDWGMWVHTFNELVPPDIFYKEHPEYFAEVKEANSDTTLS
jgi:hypothetical protein